MAQAAATAVAWSPGVDINIAIIAAMANMDASLLDGKNVGYGGYVNSMRALRTSKTSGCISLSWSSKFSQCSLS